MTAITTLSNTKGDVEMGFIIGVVIGLVAGSAVTWLYAKKAIAKVHALLDKVEGSR